MEVRPNKRPDTRPVKKLGKCPIDDDVARAEWARLGPALFEAGLIRTERDISFLAAYVFNEAVIQRASYQIIDDGFFVRTRDGVRMHPSLKLIENSMSRKKSIEEQGHYFDE